jgi:ABC-type spermidine/putrescine transport system permease subunit I
VVDSALSRQRLGRPFDKHLVAICMLGPLVLFLLVFYALPFANMLTQSLNPGDGVTDQGLTLQQYVKTWDSNRVMRALARTFRLSVITVMVTLLIAYPIALLMVQAGKRTRTLVLIVTFVSLAASLIVRNYGWLVVLSDGGPINRLLLALGLLDKPVRMMYSEGATVVALVHYGLPFMILPIYGALLRLPISLSEAARSLGGSDWATFRTVVLPLSMPGVFGGTMLVFAVSMSSFVTPLMLGSPSTALISQVAAEQFLVQLNFPWG